MTEDILDEFLPRDEGLPSRAAEQVILFVIIVSLSWGIVCDHLEKADTVLEWFKTISSIINLIIPY